MKTSNTIRATVCRGIVTSAVLIAALAIRADENNAYKAKESVSSTPQSTGAADPAKCVQEAAKMNLSTIRFGQLAAQKAENPELKRFGQTLEQDHKKAQSDLERIAKKQNVTLPTVLEAKCEEEVSRLQALSGAEFDREFAKGAVEGHAMALAHLQRATTEVKDPDLRQYTQKMLAQMKDHQRHSREIARAVGVDQATITALESKAQEGVGAPGTAAESSKDSSKDQQIRK